MLTQKLPNAAGTLITVTTVATSLQSLIETAASAVFSLARLDGIDLRPDGDIRFLADGNTPTSTEGLLLDTFTSLRGIDLSKMQLISPSGSVTVEIQVGKTLQGETDSIQSAGGGGGGGSPAGSDTELQYNNAGSFGGTTDLIFLAGLGLSIQGSLSYGWNTADIAFGVNFSQQGSITPQLFVTQNVSTETVGTDILTNTLDFAVQPTSFQLFGSFTSSDFPATDVGYSFIVSKNEMVYSLGTSGATGPTFTLNYDTAAQANGDVFNFDFKGRNDLIAPTKYAGITTTVIDSTAAAEVGRLGLSTIVAGVDTVGLFVENGQAFSTTGTAAAPSFVVDVLGQNGIYLDSANTIGIAIQGIRRFTFGGSQIRGSNGTAALPVYTFIGDPDTGMFLGGVNTLSFSTGATTKLQINSNTNIESALQLTFTATTTPTITANAIGRGASGMLYNSPTGSSHIQTINGVSAFTVNGVGEAVKVTDTITASVTQTQGQQPLVSSYNIVTVVATANNAVTLPSAITGQIVRVKNEGANTLQVFPALGDSVNNGAVDASVTQATATFFMYIADDATNYTRVQMTIA